MTYRLNKGYVIIIMLILQSCMQKETSYNMGFETLEQHTSMPQLWSVWDEQGNYNVYADSLNAFSGKRSLLLECKSKEGPVERLGGGILRIPVDFTGSQVTLTGYIKTEGFENGMAGLLMKIEGNSGWNLVENMASQKVQHTADWKQYEIKLPLKAGARYIYIGAYSTGSGKVWIDNMEILVDGKAPGAGGRIPIAPSLKDTSFLHGSGIAIDSLSPRLLNDLVILGKVWGFLKYYHPAIAAGQFNWDAELFRILPRIIAAGNKADRNNIMLKWIKGLGHPEVNNKLQALDSTNLKLLPDLDWIGDKEELGEPLSEELKLVRHSSWNENHFYVDLDATGKPIFMNESQYFWLRIPDDGYQLLALYRYWNIIQYYYPYKHLIGEDWTNMLSHFIPQFIHVNSPEAYQLTVMKMIAAIQDSHGNLTGRTRELYYFMGSYIVPAEVRFVEGKATIISVPKGTDGLQKGDVILKVNGKTVKEIQDRLEPLISASTEPQKLFGMASRLLRGNDSTFFIKVARDGRTVALKLNSNARGYQYPAYDQNLQPGPWTFLSGDVGYTFLGKLRKEEILPMMNKFLASARGIIIDLRCYPLDHVEDELCRYFSNKQMDFIRPYIASIQRPGLFNLRPALKVGGAGMPQLYKDKVILLVNEFTESRGEFIAMALKTIPNVTVIGSTTAGTDGDVSDFYLPGGLKTRISGVGYCWPGGAEVQRIGIVPDIIVQPTLKGVRAGRDEVLDFALSYIKK